MKPFKIEAAKDLGLGLDDFKGFLIVYRNGVQHQGTPKKYIDKNGIKYVSQISDEFNASLEIYKQTLTNAK